MILNKDVLNNKSIFVTGASGFIGANLVQALINLNLPMTIVGLDNLNDYYDVSLKNYRLEKIEELSAENDNITWKFVKGDLADKNLIDTLFKEHSFDIVVNLAAQAGVRYSIDQPDAYIGSNSIFYRR